MQKRRSVFIVCLTVAVALILTIFVAFTIKSVNHKVTKSCFEELAGSSKHLAEELYKSTEMDHTILTAMAAVIADSEKTTDADICNIMKTYKNTTSFVSYVELLRPDNTLLGRDGFVSNVTGILDFSDEIEKGSYISGISQDIWEKQKKVIRNAVPVIKDGKTIYMLYGIVYLSDFAEKYKTNIYDGHAYVYLEDGDTGDFLLDTWHKTFGNISDFSNREMLPGYSFKKAIADMQKGIGGDLGFTSKTTDAILYMHYEPVGINNWNVIISVEKEYALRESNSISSILYRMAVVVGVIILLYMGFVLYFLIQAYRHVQKLGMEDQTTGLQNRNAYDAFIASSQQRTFTSIICIYIDANGLHELNNKYGHLVGDQMLRIIADALKQEFQNKEIYRVGGDEFVVFCENDSFDSCKDKIKNAYAQIELHDYNISYGIVCRKNEMGVDRITQEAHEKMLENKKLYYVKHNRRHHR